VTDHLTPDLVSRLVKGGLRAADNERTSAHLETCAECQRAVTEAVSVEEEAPSPMQALAPGTRVSRFVLRESLGDGAGGTLYEADDPGQGRRVVIKFLRPDRHAELVSEEQGLTRLSHPNVVNVLDAGEYQGQPYVVMERVEGPRLDQWLEERRRPWRDVLDLFVDAARGLAAAHAVGLVHRDFKPENVVVGNDGRARITDFGLARAVPRSSQVMAAAAAAQRELAASSSSGTPAYMAPEQFRGRPADARTDQFSFCVALYRALYGQQPFDPTWAAEQREGRRTPLGSVHFSLLVKSLDRTTLINFAKEVIGGNVRPAPAGTDVPGWLEGVVWRGLRTDPEDRYASREVLLSDIEQSLEGSAAGTESHIARRRNLRRAAAIAGGVGLLALLAALAWSSGR
jgi:serine/threonine protein kinase